MGWSGFDAAIMALVVYGLVVIAELFLHTHYSGRLKRGLSIWSEPLPPDMVRFLRRLPDDIIDSKTGTFIARDGNAVLVQPHRRTIMGRPRAAALPYVGYIDLGVREPRIQYRIPISPLPFLALWIGAAIYISLEDARALPFLAFMVMIVYLSHVGQRKEVLGLIRAKMRAWYGQR